MEDKKVAEHQCWRERQVANELLQAGKDEVMQELLEAQARMEEALQKATAAEMEKQKMERQCTEKVQAERRHFWNKIKKEGQSAKSKLDSERKGFEAIISQLKVKHERDVARVKTYVSDRDSELDRQVERHRTDLRRVHEELERQKEKTQQQKQLRWKANRAAADKQAQLEEDMDYMRQWLDDMHEELEGEKAIAKDAAKKAYRLNTVAEKRLALLKELKVKVGELKDELAEESKARDSLERMSTIRLAIKRERAIGRWGGSGRWPVHIVLLICEYLVNGTPPSAVPANLQSASAAFTGAEAKELPSVNFVRQCRTVCENLNLMFAGFRLGNARKWHEIFTDGTERRQVAMQNLVIGIMEDGGMDSVLVSSCKFLENGTAEKQVEAIKEQVSFHCSCRVRRNCTLTNIYLSFHFIL